MRKPIKNIVLDFGHGGVDSYGKNWSKRDGVTFPNGEVAYEGVLNRQIGGLLYYYLRNHSPILNVVCTVQPDDPRDLSLPYRVRVMNSFDCTETLAASIHCNAFDGKARGFSIYTDKGKSVSDVLAEDIAKYVEKVYKRIKLKLRYDFSDGDKDKEADFYVFRRTRCPVVLIECLFFDNWEDYKYLKDTKFQKELAFAVYEGIMKFVNQDRR